MAKKSSYLIGGLAIAVMTVGALSAAQSIKASPYEAPAFQVNRSAKGDRLATPGNVPGVAGVGEAGVRVPHVAADHQGFVLEKRVQVSGLGFGDQQQFRVLDVPEALDGRGIKGNAMLQHLWAEVFGRQAEVLLPARKVHEAQVQTGHLVFCAMLQ